MSGPNVTLITELQMLNRRDFPVADESSLSPYSARPFIDGEWLALDANYKAARSGDNNAGTADEETNAAVFMAHTEKGRYDVVAIKKVNLLMLQAYEAETKVVNLAGLSVGSALTVQDITFGGLVYRGLALEGATAGRVRVGYVSRLPGNGVVRFIHFTNQKM
jgi:hypothetical protein